MNLAVSPPGECPAGFTPGMGPKVGAPLVAAHFGDRRRHVWGATADGSLDELKKEVRARTPRRAAGGAEDAQRRGAEQPQRSLP